MIKLLLNPHLPSPIRPLPKPVGRLRNFREKVKSSVCCARLRRRARVPATTPPQPQGSGLPLRSLPSVVPNGWLRPKRCSTTRASLARVDNRPASSRHSNPDPARNHEVIRCPVGMFVAGRIPICGLAARQFDMARDPVDRLRSRPTLLNFRFSNRRTPASDRVVDLRFVKPNRRCAGYCSPAW